MGEIPCRFPASREFPALETSSLLTVSSSGEPANHRSLPISRASGHRDGPRRVADDDSGTPDQRKNSTLASRNHRKFAGAADMGPLIANTASSKLSLGEVSVASTMRCGMLKPWIVYGLGRAAARGISPLIQISA